MNEIPKPIMIINSLLEKEREERKKNNQSQQYAQVDRLFWILVAFPAVAAVMIAILSKIADLPWLYTTSISSVGLSYIGYTFYVTSSIWTSRSKIKEFVQNPLTPQLNSATAAITIDHAFLPKLQELTLLDLELTQLELKAERDGLEKRTGLVIGTIEKLGIVPGILTTVLAYHKIGSAESLGNQIVFALTFALPFLYIMGVVAHSSITKLDRLLKLIELSISKKKTEESEQKDDDSDKTG